MGAEERIWGEVTWRRGPAYKAPPSPKPCSPAHIPSRTHTLLLTSSTCPPGCLRMRQILEMCSRAYWKSTSCSGFLEAAGGKEGEKGRARGGFQVGKGRLTKEGRERGSESKWAGCRSGEHDRGFRSCRCFRFFSDRVSGRVRLHLSPLSPHPSPLSPALCSVSWSLTTACIFAKSDISRYFGSVPGFMKSPKRSRRREEASWS
jgi:hypothetical protein